MNLSVDFQKNLETTRRICFVVVVYLTVNNTFMILQYQGTWTPRQNKIDSERKALLDFWSTYEYMALKVAENLKSFKSFFYFNETAIEITLKAWSGNTRYTHRKQTHGLVMLPSGHFVIRDHPTNCMETTFQLHCLFIYWKCLFGNIFLITWNLK